MEPHIKSNEMQKKVHEWISQFKEGYWDPHVMISILTEEVGEVARAINHIHGPKKPKEGENEVALGDELADVLFVLLCIANKHKISLSDAFEKNMRKKYGRDNDRFEKK